MAGARDEARRYVRRKRTFYTIVVVYLALVVLWFLIDVLTGSDDWWFYWPTLGAGLIVAIIGVAMFGVSGLFGGNWEKRQMDRYLERHGDSTGEGQDQR
jgi:2TM domain